MCEVQIDAGSEREVKPRREVAPGIMKKGPDSVTKGGGGGSWAEQGISKAGLHREKLRKRQLRDGEH